MSVHNSGSQAFTVDWDESKVKVSGGTWDKLANNSSELVGAGQTKSIVYGALFNCRSESPVPDPRPRAATRRPNYFPGVSSWTTDQTPTINISM